MRASRLMALLLMLQQRRGVTAAAAAAELEVSIRTIYRDVSALQEAGVPVWTETGPSGGIRLVEGWRTELDGLTADEAGALFLAGAPTAVAELGLGTILTAAQSKVLSTLPPELRTRAARVRERFHLDAPGWFHLDEPLEHLGLISEAVWDGTRLDLRYGRRPPGVARRVDPLGLVLKAGIWYLVASHRHQPRTWRVSRVLDATKANGSVQRPPNFDLEIYWQESSADFDRAILRDRVRIRASPMALRLLPQVFGPAPAERAVADATDPDGRGWREVELEVESEEVALFQLTGLGTEIEVLLPASLRRSLADVGRAVAELNA